MLTYIPYIHMGLCCPASLACQTLPYDPKSLETHSNASTTLQAVPKRSQTFFDSLYAYAYLHNIQWHTIRDYAYLTTINYTKTIPTERCGNLYQVLHVLQLQTSSFWRCVCVSCKKHVGILYRLVTFEKNARFDHWVTGSLVFLQPWYVLLLGGESFQTVPKRFQTNPNDAEAKFRKTNRANQLNKSRRILWFSEGLESR